MHHFGEDSTKGRIEGAEFIIESQHHTTGATVTMRGPTAGVFTSGEAKVDAAFVERLAREFAAFLTYKVRL